MDHDHHMNFIECQNKLLLDQQSNYKELVKILAQRHNELIKYVSFLRSNIEKLVDHFEKQQQQDPVIFETISNRQQHDQIYEIAIIKYDKKIEQLTEMIQTLQTKISDKEESIFKENFRMLTTTFTPSDSSGGYFSKTNPGNDFGDYRDCFEPSSVGGTNNSEVFEPQIELEMLDYNNGNTSTTGTFSSGGTGTSNTSPMANNQQQHGTEIHNHQSNKMAQCEYCRKYFNKTYMESHKRSHTGDKPYRCSAPGCNRTFTQTSSRNFHQKKFHPSIQIINSINSNNNNNTNVQEHRPSPVSEIQQLRCSYLDCEARFDSFETLNKHIKKHKEIGMIVMQNSSTGNLYYNEHHQQQSEQLISPIMKRPYKERKPKIFSNNGHDSSSSFSNNNNNTANSNNGDNNNGQNRVNVRQNLTATVSPNGKHICPHCSKEFSQKITLRQHLLKHGPKRFRCPYPNCNYATPWKHNLTSHLEKHHKNVNNGSVVPSVASKNGTENENGNNRNRPVSVQVVGPTMNYELNIG